VTDVRAASVQRRLLRPRLLRPVHRRLNAGRERTALCAQITYVVVNGATVEPTTPIAATDVRAARVQRRLSRLLRFRVDWEKY
jgi:hypothetical protein